MNFPAFPPELAARFRPLSHLGQGGWGYVVLAEDLELGRRVAIKLMLDFHEQAGERLAREGQILVKIRHPHVVGCFDAGRLQDGGSYLVLEHLEGRPLNEASDLADPVEAMFGVADGLEEIHRLGLVHRDVKPSNLMRLENDRIVLLDFGLSRGRDD